MAQLRTDRRSQTPTDFLIGISLLLVTILGVFAFVPTVFGPFEQADSPTEGPLAERLSGDLISNHTLVGTERTIDTESLADAVGDLDSQRAAAGIPEWKQVNVTVREGGQRLLTAGDPWYGDRAGGTSIRTIRTHGPACEGGCRLVVRVWAR